jgi:YggT family protein
VIIATARTEVAGVLSAIIYVYIILIVLHIVIQLLFSAGLRPPYNRTTNSILQFLRDTVEPFLRIFRRIIPSFGGLDFSPLLALITLQIVNSVIVQGLIHG